MARHFGREDDLILLQVRPDDCSASAWQPRHTYNLTADRSIPYNTFAKAVVATTSILGQAGDKGFFKNQAQIRNRLIFKAAGEEGVVESADFLGKKRVIKKSWGYSGGRMSRNYSEQEEHKIKPHSLRNLGKHTAIVIHCERGDRRKLLPPVNPNSGVCDWFR